MARETTTVTIAHIHCVPTVCQALGCAPYEISLQPHRNCIIPTHLGMKTQQLVGEDRGQGHTASEGLSWHPASIYLAPNPASSAPSNSSASKTEHLGPSIGREGRRVFLVRPVVLSCGLAGWDIPWGLAVSPRALRGLFGASEMILP